MSGSTGDAGIQLTLGQLAAAIGGTLEGPAEPKALRYAIDSRSVREGSVFFALAGLRTDGHRFLAAVTAAAAAAAVVRKDATAPPGLAVIRVVDTAVALAKLGRHFRAIGDLKVVGITGSSGKTTTKDFCASLLAQVLPVFKSEGNLNTTIGLPLTLTQRRHDHRIAVLEMGMSFPGELRRVSAIATPDVAVITNIGLAHIQNFASADAIASAKAEILDHLRPGGTFVANADDPRVARIAADFKGKVVRFGYHADADIRVSEIETLPSGGSRFKLTAATFSATALLAVAGAHHVHNAAAALAVADALGLELDTIVAGLAELRAADHRGGLSVLTGMISLLDDCYNANPDSTRAALTTLRGLTAKRRIAVLGDMLELGTHAQKEHESIGQFAAECCDLLIGVGGDSQATVAAARSAGIGECHHLANAAAAVTHVPPLLLPGDAVLVKGSRGIGLEIVIDAIRRSRS